ncbi:hypothetical protein QAD02_004842 [Eretmocerus hayati]|uniref:Uncharacterized protein n=1 Tax=Eretmocerus hayati TaxID=131215 RepID=A0ACC2NQU9_9HYME|nr:hypothetical protein QAD02_004842 [Eretmocerus hayati]
MLTETETNENHGVLRNEDPIPLLTEAPHLPRMISPVLEIPTLIPSSDSHDVRISENVDLSSPANTAPDASQDSDDDANTLAMANAGEEMEDIEGADGGLGERGVQEMGAGANDRETPLPEARPAAGSAQGPGERQKQLYMKTKCHLRMELQVMVKIKVFTVCIT